MLRHLCPVVDPARFAPLFSSSSSQFLSFAPNFLYRLDAVKILLNRVSGVAKVLRWLPCGFVLRVTFPFHKVLGLTIYRLPYAAYRFHLPFFLAFYFLRRRRDVATSVVRLKKGHMEDWVDRAHSWRQRQAVCLSTNLLFDLEWAYESGSVFLFWPYCAQVLCHQHHFVSDLKVPWPVLPIVISRLVGDGFAEVLPKSFSHLC